MKYIETPGRVISPAWTQRNLKIANEILPNKSVLDLGCGSKDLLKYISPASYIGIDYNNEFSDMQMNFNEDFTLPSAEWDYIVCSGLLEYIVDINKFFSTISKSGNNYIISFWHKNDTLREKNRLSTCTMDDFINILNNYFSIERTITWKSHNIFVCKDKN